MPVGLLQRQPLLLGPLPLDQLETTRPWLHDGALKAIFHVPASSESEGDIEAVLAELSALPRERVGVCLTLQAGGGLPEDVTALAQVIMALIAGASIVLVRLAGAGPNDVSAEAEVAFGKALHQATKPRGGAPPRELVLGGSMLCDEGATIAALHQLDVHVLSEANPMAAPTPEAPLPLTTGLDAVSAFVACLRTDRPDGLYTTVVVDECNTALGLVYSSAGSIRVRFAFRSGVRIACLRHASPSTPFSFPPTPNATQASVAEGRGIYYSRSRGGLWRKGDSSGAVQDLVALDFDCDSDALRFIVRQRGDPPVRCLMCVVVMGIWGYL